MITNAEIINEAMTDIQNPEYITDAVENICNIVFSEIAKSNALKYGMMELYHQLIIEQDAGIRTMILSNLQSRCALTKAIVDEFCDNIQKAVEKGANA